MHNMYFILLVIGLYYIQIQYAYDFTTSGEIDLVVDNGFSELGSACVGYIEWKRNWNESDTDGPTAGNLNITLTTHNNAPNNTVYIIAFYIKPPDSMLSCEEKINDKNRKLMQYVNLLPGDVWRDTFQIHDYTSQYRWYFYLVKCDMNMSVSYPLISYQLDYWDSNNAKDICSNVLSPALIRLIIGVALALLIVAILLFVYYIKRKQKKNKNENVLMESLNVNEEDKNDNQLYNLLVDWSLEKYCKVIIDENGYSDLEQWKDLSIDDLKEMGFTQQDSKRFVDEVQQYFSNQTEKPIPVSQDISH
eukprot:480447_1